MNAKNRIKIPQIGFFTRLDPEKSIVDNIQEKEAEEWLEEFDADLFSSYIYFQLKDETLYPKILFTDNMKNILPRKWWLFVKNKASKPGDDQQVKFAEFMVSLHSCPSSSASLERWFSTFGFVWSKTRNRLGHEKAMKLVKCFKALRV